MKPFFKIYPEYIHVILLFFLVINLCQKCVIVNTKTEILTKIKIQYYFILDKYKIKQLCYLVYFEIYGLSEQMNINKNI